MEVAAAPGSGRPHDARRFTASLAIGFLRPVPTATVWVMYFISHEERTHVPEQRPETIPHATVVQSAVRSKIPPRERSARNRADFARHLVAGVKENTFPAPIKLSERVTVWRMEEILT